ncbi:hypothetical protein Vspart_03281 [Vibrio spartinae]|uniref:Uncharacterized protein n=1 Tax=Vibrio spartinae TaxID=1918945 RepID=A0A1N6M9X3_9VIBR|nr:hypothetical protein Vspart_03281 [Vibrio spartinae]SIO96252.1 hypothetical protein VSP9026_04036 [Vibrio spartinae]
MGSLLQDAQHTRNSLDSGVFKLIFSSAFYSADRRDDFQFGQKREIKKATEWSVAF